MTTFKNNSKYAEVLFTYLELAERRCTPLMSQQVLATFVWKFKGGSLRDTAKATRLAPTVSPDYYPHGFSSDLAEQWPSGQDCRALRSIVANRLLADRMRMRAVLGRLGTYRALTADFGNPGVQPKIYSGLHAVYQVFAHVWKWAETVGWSQSMDGLEDYTRELLIATGSPSRVHLPTAESNRVEYWQMLSDTKVAGLLKAISQIKQIIQHAGSREVMARAKMMGKMDIDLWENEAVYDELCKVEIPNLGDRVLAPRMPLGPLDVLVLQGVLMIGRGKVRYALGRSDMERLHQLMMSTSSALVGVCAQACIGTPLQKQKAKQAVVVAGENLSRIVRSGCKVAIGDEVLVCKGYRRAYTAYLGRLAGPLCRKETEELVREAKGTAPEGVLDVDGMLSDLQRLDAASGLNAAKMFKICPAPDVSPGLAFMDRVAQIGNGNTADEGMMVEFEVELKAQILRAYIRSGAGKLDLRPGVMAPSWYVSYCTKEYDKVPSGDIDTFLAWEGAAKMPDVSPNDPKHWKDSGLGADTIRETKNPRGLGRKANMITRLIYDDECPMPGTERMSEDHVIKFFMKAEGHKDPARGIFSANLLDRQAQSWMEKAVEKVATHHPSFMIGQEVHVREARVVELTSRPKEIGLIPLYYSFDISGWSAKMPGEPQKISHDIWAKLYGGHLFSKAKHVNENAHIYLNLDGYMGWFKNTRANLEGFNGKEMTMVLIALLSLSVRRWKVKVVDEGVMPKILSDRVSALLFAYIDDGLSRIDLPKKYAVKAFELYKETVIETFEKCGFSVEVSKCFPSDRFAIFLNEVYLAGRHVVHGVRAAMGISSEPTERHTSLVERVTSVSTGVRGAVMAGLNPQSAAMLMAYHVYMHLVEWVGERDPVVLATWSLLPRAWGGLGMPNMMQLYVSGSGSAFEEGVSSMQAYAKQNQFAKRVFLHMSKGELSTRSATSVLTAPLSGRVDRGYMLDSRVSSAVRIALRNALDDGLLSRYATRLLKYANPAGFEDFAESVIPLDEKEVLQEQMIDNVAAAHPHSIFSAFARRLEKSNTLMTIVGKQAFQDILQKNKEDAIESVAVLRTRV